ncbi:MsnO8 family LLM class oxidoreductase [Virgibacillus halodenitrificans]|uniref:LLM class flavin-dependent oxidoreductase n=1 Tax=Virgibacillus halodenitrificans TaxID=1482 RepID=A0AAC9NM91_VIRHA|nr:LLM class flavin-dependent oxidoreductase [Virgibacillus halodenitrificans]APC49900.1 luciferase [Virgibacillus halodenitrificans]MBD1223536.1 LLM class flavin-dependent oxidoreductase [Virgibacillus halodenitrificans]MCJ0933112.1 LLM class flavin-dependent oxidoreductase [Virgibacillus halodenitrificans]MYL46172.1 MsnO8 family LLM class oxidoreductase [Virgibacillus halodenitrificans]CDQ31708.1 Limonene 1,2-monooxygenase [Virgibacillus halodenitrificans]
MDSIQPKTFHDTPLSVLDLAPVNEGTEPTDSFKNSVELAQHVEQLGFNRYWLAEHHNMPGIASSATSVIMGHIAEKTSRIRVGAGGIMLPNHATLVIAEQFGTLESLYPERIDLGLGRAPGSDQATAYALRRTLNMSVEDFPMQVNELQDYFSDNPISRVKAVPGQGLSIPIWLLGSSDFSARLAAKKGLRFSFASHFAPAYTVPALNLYRENFQPSEELEKPYAMVGVNVIAADTDEHAQFIATSLQQQFLNLRRGRPTKLQPPIQDIESEWTPMELAAIKQSLDPRSTIIGDKEKVRKGLESFIAETQADEVIISSQIYNQADRLRSYEIIGELME